MVTSAATFVYHSAARGLDVTLALPRVTVRTRPNEPAAALFRALALLEPIHDQVHQIVDRNSVYFGVGGRHDAKSA
jgi:hypothetical protein